MRLFFALYALKPTHAAEHFDTVCSKNLNHQEFFLRYKKHLRLCLVHIEDNVSHFCESSVLQFENGAHVYCFVH